MSRRRWIFSPPVVEEGAEEGTRHEISPATMALKMLPCWATTLHVSVIAARRVPGASAEEVDGEVAREGLESNGL